ncbi:V-set domain containing T-cell activation inhibitor 1-like isoform X2 [Perca flavescens]|uniref:V-set domain containing T-cell activation inhibitor 1-like isoform X2 n=1 Tax=Perca flavescens TaxID=8167 RepID=UPI00106EDEBA|nr:V-set domain containing T-cell activation inhibitor 1-like isoform X2 [Perca flavescens]
MDLMLLVGPFILAVYSVTGRSVGIISQKTVKVVAGHDAILPCHLKPPFNETTLMVQWKRDGKQVHLYRSKADSLDDQDKNFRKRTSLFRDKMDKGNCSLKLTNVTEEDAGNYTCHVRFKNESGSNKVSVYNVTLIVDTESKQKPDPNISGENPVPVIGILGAIFVGLFVIAAVIVCVKWKPCGNNKPEPKTDNGTTGKRSRGGRRRRRNNKNSTSDNMQSTSEASP